MVTSEQLERWEGMCEAATESWVLCVDDVRVDPQGSDYETVACIRLNSEKGQCVTDRWGASGEDIAELQRIVDAHELSRTAMPMLIQRVRELMDEVECYEGMKDGVSVRIADLEAKIGRLRSLVEFAFKEAANQSYDAGMRDNHAEDSWENSKARFALEKV